MDQPEVSLFFHMVTQHSLTAKQDRDWDRTVEDSEIPGCWRAQISLTSRDGTRHRIERHLDKSEPLEVFTEIAREMVDDFRAGVQNHGAA